eukprot:1004022-Rhodomonas_salina.2
MRSALTSRRCAPEPAKEPRGAPAPRAVRGGRGGVGRGRELEEGVGGRGHVVGGHRQAAGRVAGAGGRGDWGSLLLEHHHRPDHLDAAP